MNHYMNKGYLTGPRLLAYLEQFKYVENGDNILEIGSGAGVFGDLVRRVANYSSFDMDETTNPDFLGDVTQWDLMSHLQGKHDTVFCCQVLEHMPYQQSLRALENLRKLGAARIVVSIPDNRKAAQLCLNIRRFQLKGILTVPWTGKDVNITNNDEHHWEIWRKNYKRVINDFSSNLGSYQLRRHYRCYDRFKQHFFVFEKEN